MSEENKTLTYKGIRVTKETAKGLQVRAPGKWFRGDYGKLGVFSWVPKSAIVEESAVQKLGDEGDLTVLAWWQRVGSWLHPDRCEPAEPVDLSKLRST